MIDQIRQQNDRKMVKFSQVVAVQKRKIGEMEMKHRLKLNIMFDHSTTDMTEGVVF